jgi:polyisoprenoid-binding protein YceI
MLMPSYVVDTKQSRFYWLAKATMHKLKAESKSVGGRIEVDLKNPAVGLKGEILIPVASFKAEEADADPKVAEWTAAAKYPQVRIELIKAISLPGAESTHRVDSRVTFHGATKLWSLPVKATENGTGRLLVTGSHEFKLTDFGIKPPAFLVVIRAHDYLKVDWNLALQLENK